MSRNATALELQRVIEDLQLRLQRAAQLAEASGRENYLVHKRWFRGALSCVSMAAGDLHSRGLWLEPLEEKKPEVPAQ